MKLHAIPLIKYALSFSIYYWIIGLNVLIFLYSEFVYIPGTEKVHFKRNDPKISKSYVPHELVGNWACLFISGGIALIVITGYCTAAKSYLRKLNAAAWLSKRPEYVTKEWHLLSTSIVCLLLIMTVNGALTCMLKLLIGNLRPDFLARCQLEPTTASTEEFYTIEACHQKDKSILYDGLKSTPSGHSSFVTCGLGFLFMWQRRFVIGHYARHLWCILLAIIVMISRIIDHRHFWYDVLSGSLVGLLTLYICWNRLFNHVTSSPRDSQLPLPVTA